MKKNKYIFLSHFIEETTPTYGNRDKFSSKETSKISEGNSANSSEWHFSTNHLGTHIDAPKHFYDDGSAISDFPADFWIFDKVSLIDIETEANEIISNANLFRNIPKNIELLLIRTGFEKHRGTRIYWENNPGLSPELADFFRREFPELRAVGFDFISLTSFQNRDIGKKAHSAFLDESKNAILIIEDMKLNEIHAKIKNVEILPILVKGANGAPATVLSELG